MAEGLEVFLLAGGFAALVGLLARCSAGIRACPEAWHRDDTPKALSQPHNVVTARAIYDPDWQWHWEARDRQLQTMQVTAMEKLRAEIEAANAEARAARAPSNATAPLPPSLAESRDP